jgi:hypothetical protein
VLDRFNAAGISATPLHARTSPRSLVLATGDAQAGTKSRVTGAPCCRVGARAARRGGRRRAVAHQSVSIQRLRRRFAGADVRSAARVGEQRFLHTKPSGYRDVRGVAPARPLEAHTGVVAAPVPSILLTPAKLVKIR